MRSFLGLVVLLMLAASCSDAPAPLVDLPEGFSPFREDFNAGAGSARVVTLLPPT